MPPGTPRNAAKRVRDNSPGPWSAWTISARHARAIKFIEEHCILPKGYGAGKPIVLAEYQKAWLEEVLAPGITSAAMSVPRGNGKSTFLAAVGLWALFDEDDTGAAQIPVVATTISQAIRSVYGVALAMVNRSDELAKRSLIYSAIGGMKIVIPRTSGELFPVSSDPDGLQGLDPSLAICDEVGFQPIESWDSLMLAAGKRPHSLTAAIGTPGFTRDNALWHLRQRQRSGQTLPGFSFTEYVAEEGCDLFDEKEWERANPALAEGFMNPDALRTAVALSPDSHFRIFRLGQWIDGVTSWLGEDGRKLWNSLEDPYAFVPGAPTWLGVDIALRKDTSAIVTVQKRDDGRLHAKARIWHPQPGGKLDVSAAMQHIREEAALYDVKLVSYDPRFFELPAQELLNEGYPMVEEPQSIERMSRAVGETYELIKRGELSHDGTEAFADQVLQAVPQFNQNGFTLKKDPKLMRKIDSAVALCLAAHAALQIEPPKKTVGILW